VYELRFRILKWFKLLWSVSTSNGAVAGSLDYKKSPRRFDRPRYLLTYY
jgi:hypothetical protein